MRTYEVNEEARNLWKNTVIESVRIFEKKYNTLSDKYPHLYGPLSKEALYNHAMSLMNIEFFKLNDEDRNEVLAKFL